MRARAAAVVRERCEPRVDAQRVDRKRGVALLDEVVAADGRARAAARGLHPQIRRRTAQEVVRDDGALPVDGAVLVGARGGEGECLDRGVVGDGGVAHGDGRAARFQPHACGREKDIVARNRAVGNQQLAAEEPEAGDPVGHVATDRRLVDDVRAGEGTTLDAAADVFGHVVADGRIGHEDPAGAGAACPIAGVVVVDHAVVDVQEVVAADQHPAAIARLLGAVAVNGAVATAGHCRRRARHRQTRSGCWDWSGRTVQ